MAALVEFETLPGLFSALVDHHDDDVTALQYKDKKSKRWEQISWSALRDRVNALAAFLHDSGVRKGDRVALLTENRPEWAIVDLACQNIGAINVSLYTSLPASQVAYIIKDSAARVFFVSTSIQQRKAEEIFDACTDLESVITMTTPRKELPEFVSTWTDAEARGAELWPALAEEVGRVTDLIKPDDVAALIYTSGTTGTPKGVMLTHENFCTNAQSALGLVPFNPGDHHLSFLPLCHSFERTAGYTAVLAAGGKISYAESIDTVNRNLLEVSPTVMISVPRLFERVFNAVQKSAKEGSAIQQRVFGWAVSAGKRFAETKKRKGSAGPLLSLQNNLAQRLVFGKLHEKLGGNLRFAVSGGAALPKDIGEFFEAAGILLIEGYGLTETAPVLTVNPMGGPRYGTVGHVIPGVTIGIQRLSDLKIVAQLSGEDYPSNLTSEEGEIVARGPNIMKGYWNNEQATKECIDDDGWYHTGDVGRFVDGYVQITDRIKHMIVSKGGKNIYPGPIEDSFKSINWIDQLLVVGEGREFLTALVVPAMEELERFASDEGIGTNGESDLLQHEQVLSLFEKEFKSYSRKAASQEKIRRFRLIAEPFTIDNGMLTPTLKPRRKQIETHYADLIDEMYAGVV